MQEYNDRFDDITYEKGWQRASLPEIYVPPENLPEHDRPREKKRGVKKIPREKRPFKFLLLTLQLVLCALVLAAALVFKQLGGDTYEELKKLYFEQLNNSLFETPRENILDLSEIFSQGNNEF